MDHNYLLLWLFIVLLSGCLALAALVVEWLARNPDARFTRWLARVFRSLGN